MAPRPSKLGADVHQKDCKLRPDAYIKGDQSEMKLSTNLTVERATSKDSSNYINKPNQTTITMDQHYQTNFKTTPIEPLLYALFNVEHENHFIINGFNKKQANQNMRQLVRKYHPDRYFAKDGKEEASRKTKIVTSSWRILATKLYETIYRITGKQGLEDIHINHDWEGVESIIDEAKKFWSQFESQVPQKPEKETPPPTPSPATSQKRKRSDESITEDNPIKKAKNEEPNNTEEETTPTPVEIVSHACRHSKYIATCKWSNGNVTNMLLENLTRFPAILEKYLNKLLANSPRSYNYLFRNHQYLFKMSA